MYGGVSVVGNKTSQVEELLCGETIRARARANVEMGDQSQGIVESKCLLYVNGRQEQGPGGNGAESEVPQPPAKNKDY